jgi:hypothetical protein
VKALLVIVLLAGIARADDPASAFRAAEAHRSIEELEALGARRPVSEWTDDAWSEAARLAGAAGDLERERHDLEQVVAVGPEMERAGFSPARGPEMERAGFSPARGEDSQLVRRARAELDRIASIAGGAGQWAAVVAEHERLETATMHGDPKPALHGLESLVRAHSDYPRATSVRLAIARGWERDGNEARALGFYREALELAPPADQLTARIALVRALITGGELADARDELASVTDRGIAKALAADLATAEHRRVLRDVLAGVLAVIAVALVVLLRRDARSWRGVARALGRPPIEALYFAPVALVLVAVSWTGNPLVASAIRKIAGAGFVVTWISGASLEAARAQGRIRAGRAVVQALLVAAVISCVAYLVISGSQLIDMVAETVREGPAPR